MTVPVLVVVTAITVFIQIRLPALHNRINDSGAATEALSNALAWSRKNHLPLMVEFGASWCGDCLDLSRQLNESTLRDYVRSRFIVLSVDVGEFNRNLDVAKSLGVDVNQGIPTAAFFSANGGGPYTRRGTSQIVQYLKDSPTPDATAFPVLQSISH